jgi:hypothetical protein
MDRRRAIERGAKTGMGHHAFSFGSRADHLRCRRDFILGHRQVRARCTAREDARLGNLLKILVVLVCLGAILQRVLPFLGAVF